MGLTHTSTGAGAAGGALVIQRRSPQDRVVALAGNPNVGKSTLFNALTGLRQHTGNWPGKTVANAQGRHIRHGRDYILVDLPGTYSLLARSAEEEAARDFLCFGGAGAAVVVCDATCLERNLNLVLQTLELMPRTVVCVNLLDEARAKGIQVDLEKLSQILGVPVVGTSAGRLEGLEPLMAAVEGVCDAPQPPEPFRADYPPAVEAALARLEPPLTAWLSGRLPARWTALRLLDRDPSLLQSLSEALGGDPGADPAVSAALASARAELEAAGWEGEALREAVASALVRAAAGIAEAVATCRPTRREARDARLDRLFTSRATGIPVMLGLLALALWLTIWGANLPSSLLSRALFWVQDRLTDLFWYLHAPAWLHGALVLGVYRTLAWVVSVMLPPMAIFFPLFTLLEDVGYLPRVAFNMDHFFHRSGAHGRQALTMCMGLGCNACGVMGCRIIQSPRERLIAILTNALMPCNGRFPTLIALISLFFAAGSGLWRSLGAALLLMGCIVLAVAVTLWSSRLLSATALKGLPSAFSLELPPYRLPRLGQVLVRSVLDRTLFVLGRAVTVAAPAGLVIWAAANITVGEQSILLHLAGLLEGPGRLLGMDGVILLAFLLGFPANEIVMPCILMGYLSAGTLVDCGSLPQLRAVLTANGWTAATAVSVLLFTLFHFPCGTTCLTIWRETRSLRWTALAVALPLAVGVALCGAVHLLSGLLPL